MNAQRPFQKRGIHGAEPDQYGRSVLGNRLECWRGEHSGTNNVDLLIVAGIHGEEPDTTVAISKAMRTLTGIDDRICIVPCANPDGIIRGMRGNANGVDLNRNFPSANWSDEPVTHRWTIETGEPVHLSPGSSPGSEPETQALIALVETLQPRQIIALHGPLGWIDDPDDSKLAHWISEKTNLPVVTDCGYPTPGSFGSWAAEKGIPIITWEFPVEGIETLFHTAVPVLVELLSGGFDEG